MYSSSFKKDYAFGKKKEAEILDKVKAFFKDNVEDVDNTFSIYDFKGDKYHYELKSRTNAYNDYPTTLLPEDKIFAENQIFLFNFTDGLYYIYYNKETFDTFEKKLFKRRLRTDIKDKEKMYVYIPVNKLTKID
jgi:hypothetical protein